MIKLDALSEREKDLLLTHFFHYLPQHGRDESGSNNRGTLMREYPGIYNRLHGREIVVVRDEDGEVI